MDWIQENWVAVGFAVTGLGYLLTAVAAITPNKSDDKWAQRFWNLINKVGWNVGNSSNDPNLP